MSETKKSNVIHIDSRNPIDCADDIGTVVNATLGGKFALHGDGSFTLVPWGCGLTDTGISFTDLAGGRRFSNLMSVLAVILDIQVERLDSDNGEQ